MKKRIALFASILMLSSLACSFVSQLVEGDAPEPVEVPAQPDNVLFEEDFSDTSSGWDRNQDEDGMTDYYNDGYRILVEIENSDFWANPGLTDLPNDVRIEVEATKIGGSDDNDFGIICHYQDVENFYEFIATSDGFAGIILVQDGSPTNLSGDQLVPTTAVHQGNTVNKLRADCIGSTLSFYINGEKVLTEQDATHSYGDVGLVAGTYDEAGTDILFDDFIVTRP